MDDILNTTGAKRGRLFTWQYLSILCVFLSMCVYGQSLLSSLSPYLTSMRGFTESMAGIVVSAFSYAAMLFRPFSARTVARFKKKLIFTLCLVVMAASLLLLPLYSALLPLIFIRVVSGVAVCLGGVVSGVTMVQILPEDCFMEGIGYYGISVTAMSFLGPALGRFLAGTFGYLLMFRVLFVIMLLNIVWSLTIRFPDEPEAKITADDPSVKPWGERPVVPIVAVLSLTVLGHSSVSSFLPMFANAGRIGEVTLFYLLAGLAMISVRLYYTFRQPVFSFGWLMYASMSALAACIFLVPAFESKAVMLVTAVVYGVALGIVQPMLIAAALNSSPPHRKNAATVTYYVAIDVGFAVGSMTWGFIGQYVSYGAVFAVGGCIDILALLLYLRLRKRGRFPALR